MATDIPGAGAALATRLEALGASSGDKKAKDEQASLKKACQDFESILVGMLLKGMRNTVPKSETVDGQGGQYFREMLDDEYAKSISKSGQLGLAAVLYKQMSKATQGGGNAD